MCEQHEQYNYFPAITVGGPPGLYQVRCPINSKQWGEYCIVGTVIGAAGPGTAIVSGVDQPPSVDFTGASTYNDQTFIRGEIYRGGTNTTISPAELWHRITNDQGVVFITTLTATSIFVTIKFRVKILTKIPAPFITVNPEDMEQYHYAREENIKRHVLNLEGELVEYGREPGPAATTRKPDEQPDFTAGPAGTKQRTIGSFWKPYRGS